MNENTNLNSSIALELKDVVKVYGEGENAVRALNGIDLKFRKSEFVSILGPSGCGKTTMLNIIGGLDRYTEGDLQIRGTSTKKYKSRDWDAYRNNSIGFVFQTYNLIPHQTVLSNVELSLTLSGVSRRERTERAKEVLEKVGLKSQIHKRPNQLSGGQMQRVAIARALINNPDIILADEPTGALDTETSIQVMDILKEVAKDRLVIMVTHNPELAQKYSTRIIKMLDGKIIDDSMPVTIEENASVITEEQPKKKKGKKKKPSMSFFTAFKLSLKNLFTKKGRTILTSFAGSIGIIGIALILAVSQGMTSYINAVQEDTLSTYPLTLQASVVDMSELIDEILGNDQEEITHDKDAVYKSALIGELVNKLAAIDVTENDLSAFKTYLESELEKDDSVLSKTVSGVQYSYGLDLTVYTKNDVDGEIVKSDTNALMSEMIADYMMKVMGNGNQTENNDSSSSLTSPSSPFMPTMGNAGLWNELLPGFDGNLVNDVILEQYELIDGGSWPNEYDEIVLIVDENNELDDLTLYALGLMSREEIDKIIDAAASGQTLPESNLKWTYDQIKEREYTCILPASCYTDLDGDGVFTDMSQLDGVIEALYNGEDAIKLKVSGIARAKETAQAQMLNSGIGYTSALTKKVIEIAKQTEVVKAQMQSPNVNVLTGLPFESNTGTLTDEQKKEEFAKYVNSLNVSSKADVFVAIKSLLTEQELKTKTDAKMQELNMQAQYLGKTQREMQQLIVATALSAQAGADFASIDEYLSGMTDEQINNLAYAICQATVKLEHANAVALEYPNVTPEDKIVLAEKLDQEILTYSDEQFVFYYDNVTKFSEQTYAQVLGSLGAVDLDSPTSINLYTSSFENRDFMVAEIDKYNRSVSEDKKIDYTDYVKLLMGGITTIINAITYVLIAFVAISLIVSSIMIGVITLISVQERTKEIGILRSIGASKRDVSSMFNAETLIIGFTSGLLGVVVTYLLCIPINLILNALTGLSNLKAILPFGAAVILVLISMGLTLISGLIPSRSAAKKDPVIALRTE